MAAARSSSEDNAKASLPDENIALPDEIIVRIASYLDVSSLLQTQQVSRRVRSLLSTDAAGWQNHYELLRRSKVFVVARQDNDDDCSSGVAMKLYRSSCLEALRQDINPDELCGAVWSFRFKPEAGSEWTLFDPWHQGRESRKMVFGLDGRVLEVAEESREGRLDLRRPFARVMDDDGVEITWRFVSFPCVNDETRGRGAYVRLRVGGNDVPTYFVRRHSNWGFVMENCWGVFASFYLEKKTGSTSSRKRGRPSRDDLAPSLTVTPSVQWHEVLLYNLGVSELPEG